MPLTQHCDCGVALLRGVGVELAEVSSFIGNGDICQRHFEFTAGKIQQLKPAVLQSCEQSTGFVTETGTVCFPSPAEGDAGAWKGSGRVETPSLPHPEGRHPLYFLSYCLGFCTNHMWTNSLSKGDGCTCECVYLHAHTHTPPMPSASVCQNSALIEMVLDALSDMGKMKRGRRWAKSPLGHWKFREQDL